MARFFSMDFVILLACCSVLLILHECGHYVAYYALGIKAKVRWNIIAPGIDPVETVTVSRWHGLFISLNGFIFAGMLFNLPLFAFGYKYWHVVLIGGVAGSVVDVIWACGMLGGKTVTIQSR